MPQTLKTEQSQETISVGKKKHKLLAAQQV